MSNQRTTFAKRQREQNKKDKLKAKQERLAARRSDETPRAKGPPIATFAEAQAMITAGAPPVEIAPVTPSAPPSDRQRDTQAARVTGPSAGSSAGSSANANSDS